MFLTILFVGCQKEDQETLSTGETAAQKNLSSSIKLEEISFSKFVHEPHISATLNSVLYPRKDKKSNLKSSTSVTSLSGFFIDDTKVNKVETESFTTYTFGIRRNYETPDYFENLLIVVKENNARGYLIRYTPTALEKGSEHHTFSFKGTRNVYPLDLNFSNWANKTGDDCEETVYEIWCSYEEDHVAGPACFEANDGRTYVKEVPNEECQGTSTGDGTTGGDGGFGPGGGGDYEPGDPTNPDTGLSVPTYPDGSTTAEEYLINSLSPVNLSQRMWINDPVNSSKVNEILNFLTLEGRSEESKNFAKAAIDAFIVSGQVDFQNKFIKDPSFIGTKAECVLDELVKSENNIFKKTSEAFTGGRSQYRIKFTTYYDPEDLKAEARAGLPNSKGIIEIKFNLAVTAQYTNSTALSNAINILHEIIHAELHRIKLSNNAGPNPLPVEQFNTYMKFWDFFDNPSRTPDEVATLAEHYIMSEHYITPIAEGLREFDKNLHDIENYKYFAWQGLESYGKQAKLITNAELYDLAQLTEVVLNDSYNSPCDN